MLDGDTFEVIIDGRRVAAAVLGVDAPTAGTPCGEAARAELRTLIGRGVVLEDDPSHVFDARKRRVYRVSTPDGRSVAGALVSAGMARATGLGPEAAALAAAEARARQDGAGCVWSGRAPAPTAAAQFAPSIAATVPANFVDEIVVSGLSFPSAFAFLPDGRVLVAEQEGRIRLVTNNVLQVTPVLDISARVNKFADRGILGLAVDPSFTVNRRFYVFYTYEGTQADDGGPKANQVARFTLREDNTADPNAGVVILGTQPGAGCGGPLATADCLPAENWSHGGGSLRFGPGGSLYVSTGDAASYNFVDDLALRTQSLDSLAGKILRVDTNGKGLSSNPHWDGNADHARSKIWARGFRNPFRMTVRPGFGSLYVGDVGWATWEEINVVPGATNGGWPCYEGDHVQDGYKNYPVCASLIGQDPPTVRAPLLEWDHSTSYGPGGAAMVGAFYTGTAFPGTYQGALFYADYAHGWVKSVRVDSSDRLASSPAPFADGIPGPVQIESGPDGALWYLAIGSGELRRIRYVGSYTPIQCPNGQWRAEYHQGMELLGVPVVSRCEPAIDYFWDYASPVAGVDPDHFSVRWTGRFTFGNDTYEFRTRSDDGARMFVDGELIIDDWGKGAANDITVDKVMTAGEHTIVVEYFEDCCPAEMRASWTPRNPNTPPTPTITSPAAGTRFKVGDVIPLAGSASDAEQDQIPAANLRWDVILHHCPGFGPNCHEHPHTSLTGTSGQFVVPDHGDGSYFEVRLSATDSGGLTGVTSRQVDPKTIQVTLATSPSGGTVVYDGTSHTPPYTATTIAGSTHTIAVEPPAGQPFGRWAHGGPQQQNVTVGDQDVTYIAIMAGACAPRPRVALTTSVIGGGRLQVTVSTTTNSGAPPNTLKSIQFQEMRHAVVEAPGHAASAAPFTLTAPGGTSQTSFVVRRTEAGSVLVRFVVTDDCGAWPTFVGGGPSAGF